MFDSASTMMESDITASTAISINDVAPGYSRKADVIRESKDWGFDIGTADYFTSSVDLFWGIGNLETVIRADAGLLNRVSCLQAIADIMVGQYVLDNKNSVKQYLTENHDVLNFIIALVSRLEQTDSISCVSLDVYDAYEDEEFKIFVIASTSLEDVDEIIEMENLIFTDLFDPNICLLSGRVILSIR
ncbi:hypothetical protein OAE19_04815 [Porticoccaceae bacterium]|nr:hypothetical protein [Porticoccaceae bacterium]